MEKFNHVSPKYLSQVKNFSKGENENKANWNT